MIEAPNFPSPRLLVVEDDPDSRILLCRQLRVAGYTVEEASSLEQALERMASSGPHAVCLDLGLPDASGVDALDTLRRRDPTVPIVVLTAETDVDVVVTAMQKGAFGYLAKPVAPERLLEIAGRAVLRGRMERVAVEDDSAGGARGTARLLGPSHAMADLRLRVRRVAASDVAVLVQGESGVGKELVARALHDESARSNGAFVALNCAAIPESLQEAELFGHEKGAFTGAHAAKRGYFELAAGGTLFLDEVAELAPSLQAKLLRAVQEKSFRRVGGTTDVASDFRLVAASHRTLWDEVAAGRFRDDLYYRLAVFELRVPPLRERGQDVLFLCRMFVKDQFPDGRVTLSPEAEQLLLGHPWPGNVRELKNALHHALVLRSSDMLTAADFPERVQASSRARGAPAAARSPASVPAAPVGPAPLAAPAESAEGSIERSPAPPASVPAAETGRLDEMERQAIMRTIASVGGSMTEAARRLGISRATLYRRLKQYQLS
jgi:two-component system response regulator FlrC